MREWAESEPAAFLRSEREEWLACRDEQDDGSRGLLNAWTGECVEMPTRAEVEADEHVRS